MALAGVALSVIAAACDGGAITDSATPDPALTAAPTPDPTVTDVSARDTDPVLDADLAAATTGGEARALQGTVGEDAMPEEPSTASAGDSSSAGPMPVRERITIQRPLSLLSHAAAEFIATRAGRVSVTVIDLQEGVAYYHRPDLRFELVSVGKVPILITLLERAQLGRRELYAWEADQAQLMIVSSDNDATTIVWSRVGRDVGVAGILRRIGLGSPQFELVWDWGAMEAGALAVALLFAEVADGEILSDETQAASLDLLRKIDDEHTWGVTAGFETAAAGETLAFKNGWYWFEEAGAWAVHSVGVVLDAAGEARYVVAVLSDGQATHPDGIDTIEGIAREIHQALSPVAAAPAPPHFWR